MNHLRLWAMGDAHVGRDLSFGRKSLAEPLLQSEQGGLKGGPPFEWDIAINVGDYSGAHGTPTDEEGREVVRQFGILKQHRREQVYSVCGNHDRSGVDEPEAYWFRKWIDPLGENTRYSQVERQRYPYPVDGTWERYSFSVGNILFLMMSDINEPSQKIGRGPLGGHPGGAVRQETFDWWRSMVESNQDKIIVSVHHYVLKDTTVASGEWEGMTNDRRSGNYHKYYKKGTPQGASYLYWVGGVPDSGAFEKFLAANPGAVDIWMGGHTHAMPEDTFGGKPKIHRKWGTTFMNVCPLTRYTVPEHARPHSRLLTFSTGSDAVRVQCYRHTDEQKAEGWDASLEVEAPLKCAFSGCDDGP